MKRAFLPSNNIVLNRLPISHYTLIFILLFNVLFISTDAAAKASEDLIELSYLKVQSAELPGVPTFLVTPDNEGINGAESAINDANKTGKFLGYQLRLTPIIISAAEQLNESHLATIKNSDAVLIDSDPMSFKVVMEAIIEIDEDAVIFNTRNHDSALRSQYCSTALLHVAPNYNMKADALAQWLKTKRIKDVLIVSGPSIEDKLYAASFEQSAKQFKLTIVENKPWEFTFDLRRSAFEEIPAFTRIGDKYDAVFAADHARQFAYSLPYNTFYQVPLIGNAGIQALGWHSTHEQWGARQLQGRFKDVFKRSMTQYDYYSYVAVIALSDAIQNLKNRNSESIYKYLLSSKGSIAAYQGRKLSFSNNTRQLQQPLLLAHEGALVTSAPMPGFLHQTNDLKTLGGNVTGCKDN